jgi:hypothetical protein
MSASNVYEEYAALDAEIKALEIKKEQLRPHIIKMMSDEGIEKLEHAFGKFTIVPLKKWMYSEKVYEMADALKAQKAKEESTGEAECEITPSLRYTATKL